MNNKVSKQQIKEYWKLMGSKIKVNGLGDVDKLKPLIDKDYNIQELIDAAYLKPEVKQFERFSQLLNHEALSKNEKLIAKGKEYWKDKSNKPKYVQGYVFKKEVCETIKKNKMNGDIDLLSLDMDGIDYWILKDLLKESKCINPRVIVLEFQDIIGPDKAITVPYQKIFSGWNKWAKGGPNYSGASLLAFTKLLKNYNLVGVENRGFNAFYVRKDVQKKYNKELPTIKPSEYNMLWKNLPAVRKKKLKDRWNIVKHLDWVSV